MINTQTQKIKILCSWLTVILCMLIIYQLSSQTATTSDSVSKGIVKYGVETGIKLTKVQIIDPEKWRIIDKIDSIGREYMHGVVFLVLGLLVQNTVSRSIGKRIKAIWISIAICVSYALTDETHQLFVHGRAFQGSDLAMDFIGSIIGILVVSYIFRHRSTAS